MISEYPFEYTETKVFQIQFSLLFFWFVLVCFVLFCFVIHIISGSNGYFFYLIENDVIGGMPRVPVENS